jgi:shikimate dehydrogenase
MSLKLKYAVIGDPIHQSLSPLIHQQFAEQTGINLSYVPLRIVCESKEAFKGRLEELFLQGYSGLNITLPYKIWAFEIIQEKDGLSERAYQSGAINTISFISAEKWLGDNTDGAGLVRHMKVYLQWPIKNTNLLLLGAGGAARGVLPSLLAESPRSVDVVNRDVVKAHLLAERFTQPSCFVRGLSQVDIEKRYDLIVNATSASLEHRLPATIEDLRGANAYCYDMVYPKQAGSSTVFLDWAKQSGAKAVSDGLGMLVAQAAEAFYQWHHKMPDISKVLHNVTNANFSIP